MDFEAQARFSFSVYHHLLDISQWNLKGSQLWTFKHSKTMLFIFLMQWIQNTKTNYDYDSDQFDLIILYVCLGKYQGRNYKGERFET